MSEWCHGCPLENRPMACNQEVENCEKTCRKLWPEFYDCSMPRVKKRKGMTGEDLIKEINKIKNCGIVPRSKINED